MMEVVMFDAVYNDAVSRREMGVIDMMSRCRKVKEVEWGEMSRG